MSKSSNPVIPHSPLISVRCVKRCASQLIDIRRVEAITVSDSSHKGSMNYEEFNDVGLYMYSGNVVHIIIPVEKLTILESTFCYFQSKSKTSVPPMPASSGSKIYR